jgi:hypothetical protein
VCVESATPALEVGAALDVLAGVDDVAAEVDLFEFELLLPHAAATRASGTSSRALDLTRASLCS